MRHVFAAELDNLLGIGFRTRVLEGDKSAWGFPPFFVRSCDHCGFEDLWVTIEGFFDFQAGDVFSA